MSCPQPRSALLFIWGSSPSLHNIFVQTCILNHYKLCVLPSAGKAISYHALCFFFFAFCFPPGLPVIRKANISICNIIVYYSWDNFQVHLSFVVLQYIHSGHLGLITSQYLFPPSSLSFPLILRNTLHQCLLVPNRQSVKFIKCLVWPILHTHEEYN